MVIKRKSYKRKARKSKKSRKARKSKKTKKSKKSRKFGYSHDMGPRVYNAHMQDGILLADNAFQWMGNPLARALNAGS